MRPSQVVQELRRIASKLDRSDNPDRNLVARDLKRVVAAVDTQTVYRVVADEPIGVAVGFKPDPAALGFDFSLDEWDLVSDDGSNGEVLFVDAYAGNNEIMIRDQPPTQEELNAGVIPLGPDLEVWRSEEDLRNYLEEMKEYLGV